MKISFSVYGSPMLVTGVETFKLSNRFDAPHLALTTRDDAGCQHYTFFPDHNSEVLVQAA